jgi:integration host factor subunit beta
MKKSDLIESLAQRQNITLKDAKSIVNTILETMIATMAKGEEIQLRGFGSFQIREYASYVAKNPKTGKEIMIQAKKLPYFKVGKDLRERVNNR